MLCGSRIKLWNLANHMKKQNKKHQNTRFIDEKLKTKSLMFFVSFFFHVICKISNFNMWTSKHLAQASCTELTLKSILHWILREFLKITDQNSDQKNRWLLAYARPIYWNILEISGFTVPGQSGVSHVNRTPQPLLSIKYYI